jgi:hypothetical protein
LEDQLTDAAAARAMHPTSHQFNNPIFHFAMASSSWLVAHFRHRHRLVLAFWIVLEDSGG